MPEASGVEVEVSDNDRILFRKLIDTLLCNGAIENEADKNQIIASVSGLRRKAENRSLDKLLGVTVYRDRETLNQQYIQAMEKLRLMLAREAKLERTIEALRADNTLLRGEVRAGNVLLEQSGKLKENGRSPKYVDRSNDPNYRAFNDFMKMAILTLGGQTHGWMSRCAESTGLSAATIWNYKQMEYVPVSAYQRLGQTGKASSIKPSIDWQEHDQDLINMLAPGLALHRSQSYQKISQELSNTHAKLFSESCVKMRIMRLRKMARKAQENAVNARVTEIIDLMPVDKNVSG